MNPFQVTNLWLGVELMHLRRMQANIIVTKVAENGVALRKWPPPYKRQWKLYSQLVTLQNKPEDTHNFSNAAPLYASIRAFVIIERYSDKWDS